MVSLLCEQLRVIAASPAPFDEGYAGEGQPAPGSGLRSAELLGLQVQFVAVDCLALLADQLRHGLIAAAHRPIRHPEHDQARPAPQTGIARALSSSSRAVLEQF